MHKYIHISFMHYLYLKMRKNLFPILLMLQQVTYLF